MYAENYANLGNVRFQDYSVFRNSLRSELVYRNGELGYWDYEYANDGLGGFSLKKIWKKVEKSTRSIRKSVGKVTQYIGIPLTSAQIKKVGHVLASVTTAIGIPPRIVGVKNPASIAKVKKYAKKVRIAMVIIAVAVVAVYFGPMILTALKTAASSTIGGLKFVGSKLVGGSKLLFSTLAKKGISLTKGNMGDILSTATETGDIDKEDLFIANEQAMMGDPIIARSKVNMGIVAPVAAGLLVFMAMK